MSEATAVYDAATEVLTEAVTWPSPGDGSVPVTPRQWLLAVVDSGVVAAHHEYLDSCAAAARACEEGKIKRLFKLAIRVRDRAGILAAGLRELAWFAAPKEIDVLVNATSHIRAHAVLIEELILRCFRSSGDAARDVLQRVEEFRAEHEASERLFHEYALSSEQVQRTPWTLLLELLGLPVDWTASDGPTDVQSARSASPLSEAELGSVARRLTKHLAPHPELSRVGLPQAFTGLVLTERCVIAHRCAESMLSLLSEVVSVDPTRAAAAIGHARNRGGRNLLTHRAIVVLRQEQTNAQEEGDEEGYAIATARLYTATIEGHVKRMGATVLDLLGKATSERPTVNDVREQLLAHGPTVGRDLALSIESAWRNAIDHREFHWDAFRHELILRDEPVPVAALVDRQSAGLSAYQGSEAGIALACGTFTELNDAVRQVAPASEDAVIVVHRFREMLSSIRCAASVELSRDEITIDAKLEDLHKVLRALVDSTDDFKRLGSVVVHLDRAPTLVMQVEHLESAALRSDADAIAGLGVLCFSPVFASALVAHGVGARDAANRCSSAAAALVEKQLEVILASANPITGAEAIDRAAGEANLLVRDIERATGATSDETRGIRQALCAIVGAARLYQRGGDPDGDQLIPSLKRLRALRMSLGPASLPWFPD